MEPKDQEQVWDKIATNWKNYRIKPVAQAIKFLAGKKGRVLDLACGCGRNFIDDKNLEFYGVDFSKKMIAFAKRENYKQVIKSDLCKLPFTDNFFDYAIYISSLHCIPSAEKREQSLAELARVLKSNGRALITVWDKDQPKLKDKDKEAYIIWKHHENGQDKSAERYYYLYDKSELVQLLSKHFKIIKIYNKYINKEDSRFSRKNILVEVLCL